MDYILLFGSNFYQPRFAETLISLKDNNKLGMHIFDSPPRHCLSKGTYAHRTTCSKCGDRSRKEKIIYVSKRSLLPKPALHLDRKQDLPQ